VIFKGFSDETFKFLRDLGENNNKAWFDEHKKVYEQCLKKPLVDLSTDVSGYMVTVDPGFDINPSKAVARINRDIRFSHDKSPYKTNLWASWWDKTWSEAPGYYFEVGIDYYGYGMGFYQNKKETIERFQQRISDDPKHFKEITAFLFEGNYKIKGEKYKRVAGEPPKGLEDWWGFKNVYVAFSSTNLEPIKKPEFSKQLIDEYKKIERLYHFFMDLRGEE
jgi:uncharacterized protein (TIGR02453 family)